MGQKAARIIGNGIAILGLILGASILAPPFHAQSPVSSATRVVTLPDPLWIQVDGTAYRTNQTFAWPAGSKHVLSTAAVQDGQKPGTRYTFQNWTAGSQALPPGTSATITADPTLPEFEANFTLEFAVYISFFSCDSPPCDTPGAVYVGGAPLAANGTTWVAKGGSVTLQAVPNPGWVFAGWASGANPNQVVQGFFNTVTVNDPITITPLFQPARSMQFVTNPPELQLMIDRAAVRTPTTLDWGMGSTHTLGVVSPQQDYYGKWWVFSSWSDGGAATHPYKVASGSSGQTVTATFGPATRVSLLTSPPGLKLKIDGRDDWTGYNFSWGLGETHNIEAPQLQTDSQGRPWQFQSWSNGLPSAYIFTVPTDVPVDLGIRLIATYQQLGRVTVTSNPASVTANVDGADCRTPCVVDRPIGTSIQVSVPASVAMGQGTRADFQGWPDGSSAALAVTAAADVKTVAANYRLLNRLDISSDPAGGAVNRITPDSADGYYDSGTAVSVLVTPRPGYRFKRWDGDLSGSVPAGTLVMSAPRAARAMLDRVPYVAPAGVRNGAGDGTPDGVAPGSVISIQGASLAGDAVTGPDSPLAQTLGNVTVRIGDRLLPLFFVSPERISAQLPADIAEGPATLAVRWSNLPEVRGDFTVVRDAPGLFQNAAGDQAYAVATHEDGSLVTLDSPARKGELLTVYGTGFGPTNPPRPLGFAIPAQPAFLLLDAVSVRLGDAAVVTDATVAAPGRVGVDAIQFHLPDGVAGGAPLPLVVTVGDRASNTVLLPLQ